MPEQFHREVADEDDACDEQDARAPLSAGVVQPRAAEQRCQVLVQIVHAGSQFEGGRMVRNRSFLSGRRKRGRFHRQR